MTLSRFGPLLLLKFDRIICFKWQRKLGRTTIMARGSRNGNVDIAIPEAYWSHLQKTLIVEKTLNRAPTCLHQFQKQVDTKKRSMARNSRWLVWVSERQVPVLVVSAGVSWLDSWKQLVFWVRELWESQERAGESAMPWTWQTTFRSQSTSLLWSLHLFPETRRRVALCFDDSYTTLTLYWAIMIFIFKVSIP